MGGKNSLSGPKWAVRQSHLISDLDQERDSANEFIEQMLTEGNHNAETSQWQAIIQSVKSWKGLYHSIILLGAAEQIPKTNSVNTPEEGSIPCPDNESGEFCFENSFLLPALDFDEEDSESGLRLKPMLAELDRFYKTDALGKRAVREINAVQDTFEVLLGSYNPVSLDNFDQRRADVLAQCQASVSGLAIRHDDSDDYVKLALDRITGLWGSNVEAQLQDVNGWKAENDASSKAWWQEKLGTDKETEKQIKARFSNADDAARLAVGQEAAVANFLDEMYQFVENRFTAIDDNVISHGLDGAIQRYMKLNPEAWNTLLSITYGAVAWQIFDQARGAVSRVKAAVGM